MTGTMTAYATAADVATAGIQDAFDREGWLWCFDADSGDWYAYRDEERMMPLTQLVTTLGPLTAVVHERRDPPGPVPVPIPGVCIPCGNTGVVYHGPGIDGPVWGGPCGCDTPFCGGCRDPWPCYGVPDTADETA